VLRPGASFFEYRQRVTQRLFDLTGQVRTGKFLALVPTNLAGDKHERAARGDAV
jgi:hypothetical protein